MAEAILAEVGLRIRMLREQKLLTLEKLAKAADMDPSHLGLIERGSRDARLTTISKIATALGVPVSELFRRIT